MVKAPVNGFVYQDVTSGNTATGNALESKVGTASVKRIYLFLLIILICFEGCKQVRLPGYFRTTLWLKNRSENSLLFLTLFFTAGAQDIRKKYSSASNEQGNVYFIYPQEGFSCRELRKEKGLTHDMTYVSYKDTVTYNFTYENRQASPADSVVFTSPAGERTRLEHTMLFVDPEKPHWTHRTSLALPKSFFIDQYLCTQPYEIFFTPQPEHIVIPSPPENGRSNERSSTESWKSSDTTNK